MRKTQISIFVLFLLLLPASVYALSVDDIQSDVICTCGCGKILENCDCATAERMRSEIKEMIASGMSKEQIISEFQSMYGKEVLANPPKEGVFAGLWYYPVVVLGVGIAVIYVIFNRRNAKWYADPDEVINEEDIELEH